MTESLAATVRGRWRPGARVLFRTGRRTLVESLYLLTAPVIAGAGLLLVFGGLFVGTFGWLLPGGSRVVAGALAPARWFAGLERWRIAVVRAPTVGAEAVGQRARPKGRATVPDPALWLDVAHTVVVFPVALVTAAVTAVWWLAGLGAATSVPRALSMGHTSPDGRLAAGTVLGLLDRKSVV